MIPIKLRISGFTSYSEAEPAELDFTGFDLACISGMNGAGKSSLLDAITYALYGEARRRDEAIINSASKKAEVTLDFLYEGQTYRVTRSIARGKGSQVAFYIFNPETTDPLQAWRSLNERTLTETNAAIERTLRLDYETFVNASFFLQGKADSFATQKPADRKRILSSIMGLDQWERYREQAVQQRKEKEADLTLNKAQIESAQEEIDEEAERKARHNELEAQRQALEARLAQQQAVLEKQQAIGQKVALMRQHVAQLQTQWDALVIERDTLTQALEVKRQQLAAFSEELGRADEIEGRYQQYLALQEQVRAFDQLALRFQPVDAERQQLLTELQVHRGALNTEIQLLAVEEAKQPGLKQAIASYQAEVAAQEQHVQQVTAELQQEAVLLEEKAGLEQDLQGLTEENAHLKAVMDQIVERISKVRDVSGGVCPVCGKPLDAHSQEQLVAELTTEGTSYGDRHRENKKAIDIYRAALQAKNTELTALRAKERELQQLQREVDQNASALDNLDLQSLDWEAMRGPRLETLRVELAEEAFLPEARARIAQLESQLVELGYDTRAHTEAREQEHQDRGAVEAFNHLKLARSQHESLEKAIAEQQTELEKRREQAAQSEQVYTSAAAELAAEEAVQPDLRATQEETHRLQEELANTNRWLGAARQRLQAVEDQKRRKERLEEEGDELRAQITDLRSLETAFGKNGVPATLIEQALPEIEDQANEILSKLSNYTLSVQLVTQREYKTKRDDKMETLDIVISDGASTRDYETYSGGEAFRVNFAIRLALSRVLARRAGARLQTLVIDEGFGNQDMEGRQRLVEAINLVRENFAKVLIITHIEALKENFPTQIEVSKGPNGSRIELIQG